MHKLVIGGLLFALLAGRAAARLPVAAPPPAQTIELVPGVSYERQVVFTPHGPVAIHMITAPKPGGLYSLRPVLSNAVIEGTEKVTVMQKNVSASATVAGVNGDLFAPGDGHPSGVLLQGGVLEHEPLSGRSSIGIASDGSLHVDRISLVGYWKGNSQRHPFASLNDPPGVSAVTLYTPAWGPTTPPRPGSAEVVLTPFPAAAPNTDLSGAVVQVTAGGNTPIPPNGAVLVAGPTQAAILSAEAPVGTTVTVRLILDPDWPGVADALGGGPLLVRNGVPVFRADELFTLDQLVTRAPRTAVGQLADGRILLVAVDGRQPGYSAGLTDFELAQAMARLGAVTAAALDSGGSTVLAFDGQLLNRPSDPGGERPVSDALFVFYTGVYAPAPSEPVLSPNGDGVAEQEQLAYKVVRPSTVTAQLVGPDGAPRVLDSGAKQPGVYTFTWNGMKAGGAGLEPEGLWHWQVTAVDDQNQSSSLDRTFSVNDTLGFLKIPPILRLPPEGAELPISYTLARPAQVTATVESAAGALVQTVASGSQAPGQVTLSWDGMTASGTPAFTGRYVLRVSAANELGRVDLTSPFVVRRVASAPTSQPQPPSSGSQPQPPSTQPQPSSTGSQPQAGSH